MTTSAGTTTANYYTVLQVHPDAEVEVIEAAYRQLLAPGDYVAYATLAGPYTLRPDTLSFSVR